VGGWGAGDRKMKVKNNKNKQKRGPNTKENKSCKDMAYSAQRQLIESRKKETSSLVVTSS
jgi:hypothetical protein